MAKSRFPSWLKSPATEDVGYFPPIEAIPVSRKVPSPFPRKMAKGVAFEKAVTAKSNFPSPLKSPNRGGVVPRFGSDKVVPAVKLPVPSPSSTEIVSPPLLHVTSFPQKLTAKRSSFPSPLKSPTANCRGLTPVAGGMAVGVNVPSPLASRMDTAPGVVMWEQLGVPGHGSAIARSSFPSPLKSPTTAATESCGDEMRAVRLIVTLLVAFVMGSNARFDAPPPGPALTTAMLAVAAVAIIAARTVTEQEASCGGLAAVHVVESGKAAPFQ